MSAGVVLGDALLAAGTVTAATVTAYFARGARQVGRHNATKLDEIERRVDARQGELIKTAVEQVAREHPHLVSDAVLTEIMRDLLDALIGANLTDDEYRELHERRYRHPQLPAE